MPLLVKRFEIGDRSVNASIVGKLLTAARGPSGVAASGSLVVRPQGDKPLENFVRPGLMF